jgi:hypothetical protein
MMEKKRTPQPLLMTDRSKRRKHGMPETQDFDGRYPIVEYENSDEEREDQVYIQKFIELQSVKNPKEKLKRWEQFRTTQERKRDNRNYAAIPKILEDKEGEEEKKELDEEEREYLEREAEIDTAYILNGNSTIAITRKNGRFEDVPPNHTPGKTTDFAIPLAVDNVFDNLLCLADWETVGQFDDDERNSSSFQTVNNALLRCIKRRKDIVLKQVKGAVGHTDEQPFHGEPLLHDMEVLVLVNQVMRLVLIFRNNVLFNYCVKTPKFE